MPRRTKTTVIMRQPTKAKKKQVTKQEIGLLGKALRAMGGSAGGYVGTYLGHPLAGAAAGSSLGAAISRWLGAGDYSVSQNSLVSSVKASGSIPAMHKTDQTIVVRHKEFVCEVKGSTSFAVQKTLSINPGNKELFPWLADIASCYQQYRIKGMVFHYVPTSGSATGTNTSLGSVMMQTSYRANDVPPGSKIEMLNEYWSGESVPSEPFCHPIECNPNENPFNVQYVRSSGMTIPTQDSPLLYDLGVFNLAVSGSQSSSSVLGDLWVTYEIELKKPIVSSNVTSHAGYFGYGTGLTTSPNARWFDGELLVKGNITATCSGRQITLPASAFGRFWVTVHLVGPTMTNVDISGAPTVNQGVSIVTVGPVSPTYFGQSVSGSSGSYTYSFCFIKTQREAPGIVNLPVIYASTYFDQGVTVVITGTDQTSL